MKQEIEKAIKEAMIARDKDKLIPLRAAKTAMTNLEKSGAVIDSNSYTSVIKKLVKQGKDSEEQFRKGDRPELADKEKYEIGVLNSFLPTEIDDLSLEKIVVVAINDLGATSMKDMGKIMKVINTMEIEVSGQRLSAKVKECLLK